MVFIEHLIVLGSVQCSGAEGCDERAALPSLGCSGAEGCDERAAPALPGCSGAEGCQHTVHILRADTLGEAGPLNQAQRQVRGEWLFLLPVIPAHSLSVDV